MPLSPVDMLIAEYLYRGRGWARVARVSITTLVSVALFMGLEYLLGVSIIGLPRILDPMTREGVIAEGISLLTLIAMQFLIFWVVDAILLSRSFLVKLADSNPNWDTKVLARHNARLGLPPAYAVTWLNLQLVAERTRWVSGLVWYPSSLLIATVAFTLLVEPGQLGFANSVLILLWSAGMVVTASAMLRQSAERWRARLQRTIADDRTGELGRGAAGAAAAAQLALLSDRIGALDAGAFAPFSQQPPIRAVIVPAITYLTTYGIQFLHLGS